jgi:hypothetical protein
VIVLPGASSDDIPDELAAAVQHFRIDGFERSDLAPLLRNLTGQKRYEPGKLGEVPILPPIQTGRPSAPEEMADDDDPDRRAVGQAAAEALQAQSTDSAEATTGANDTDADDLAEWERRARATIDAAATAMRALPEVVREALFQEYFDNSPLIVNTGWGGEHRFSIEQARAAQESRLLEAEDDDVPAFTVRDAHPDIARANEALKQVLRDAFDASRYARDAELDDWARPFFIREYDIENLRFASRPMWDALGFL